MARANVTAVVEAWLAGKAKSVGPVSTDGTTVRSYGMPIAVRVGNRIIIAKRGPSLYTKTTTQHLSSVRELLAGGDYELLDVDKEDVRQASNGGDYADEVIIRNVDMQVPTPSFGTWRKNPRSPFETIQWQTARDKLRSAAAQQPKKNPSPADVRRQFDELIKEPDVAAMEVAEDLALENEISLAELGQHAGNPPWHTYGESNILARGYFVLDYAPYVPTTVGWELRKISGGRYEPEVMVRVRPNYVSEWPNAGVEQFGGRYTFALGHNTTWSDLKEGEQNAARDAWNVAKRIKTLLQGEVPIPWTVLHDEAEAAMLHAPGHERKPSKFSVHYKGPQRDQRGRFAPTPKKNPGGTHRLPRWLVYGTERVLGGGQWSNYRRWVFAASKEDAEQQMTALGHVNVAAVADPEPKQNPAIDDVREKYARLIVRGMARALWAYAYGAWAQEDMRGRAPDALVAFPSSTLSTRGVVDQSDFDGRRRELAQQLKSQPPNMAVWLVEAPFMPLAAWNAARWLGGLIVEREQVESLVDLYAIAHEIDTGEVFEYVDPDEADDKKKRPEGRELFYSDSRGTRIPQDFAEDVDRSKVTGVDDDTWATLEAGDTVENEWYWEAWDDVLQNAVITDAKGQKWRLEQDGDLFLIPEGMEWDDDEQDYVWPDADEEPPSFHAEMFGRALGCMALQAGISWFDDHKQTSADGAIQWQPNLPRVFVKRTESDALQWGEVGASVNDKHWENIDQRIRITFERVTPGEEGDEPEVESGWEDEEGVLMDGAETEEELVELTVKYLRQAGALEASSSEFHKGIWYTQTEGDMNYQTGAVTTNAYHLYGYTAEQEKAVYDAWKAAL